MPTGAVKTRPYQPADEEQVVALWRRCGLVVKANDPYADIERKTAVGAELFLVAEADGRVVGTVMAGYEGHRGWLNYVGVDPSRRREGIGRALVAAAERRLRELGCPKVNLQVRALNAEVVAFYEALGYAVEPRVSMGKRLAGPTDSPQKLRGPREGAT